MKKFISILLSLVMVFSFAQLSFAADDSETELPFANSEFYKVGDYTLHYRVYEPDEVKNQILLIHGFCLSSVSLEDIAELYMEDGYKVVLVDSPNFGYSSRENANTELKDREEVIYSLMDELGGKFIVGGHSMGGGIAINLACDYPETVTGLVLFAPQTSAQSDETTAALSRSVLVQGFYSTVLNIAARIPLLVKMLVAMSFSDVEFAKDYDISRITEPLLVEKTGAGIAVMTSHTKGADLQKFKELNIPCVIITAQNDMVASKSNLEAIIDNAPIGSVFYEFETGGHMMMEYDPVSTFEKTIDTIALA